MSDLPRLHLTLPPDLDAECRRTLADLDGEDAVRRLWARDPALWTGGDEDRWLGWLDVAEGERANLGRYRALAEEAASNHFRHALLLGMGGSSLCPDVLRDTFGPQSGHPALHVLDSTDPGQIRAVESRIDLQRTLFIVSSKSGSTLEPSIFFRYFFARAVMALGEREAPRRFVAVTDPGSKLEAEAKAAGFRHVFAGLPSIGGRYSALSAFGLVPAAVMGLDVERLLRRAQAMAAACAASTRAAANPGFVLGALLGAAARQGRDKLTIGATAPFPALGAWLEQLLAESTGKLGRGIVPVDGEPPLAPASYGEDRLFVSLGTRQPFAASGKAGRPVAHIETADPYDLGAEFLRWEIATAVAGAVLGINPFDQPDVEASKIETRKLTEEFERSGSLPAESVLRADGDPRALELGVKELLGTLEPGDYLALLAYIEMCPANEAPLQALRKQVGESRRVATCLGFGPRFLHSTGQAYKGGPPSGVFLQLTCDDAPDLAVPGARYSFGVVKSAQARGDLAVLLARGRRALRVHLGGDVRAGLYALLRAAGSALKGAAS